MQVLDETEKSATANKRGDIDLGLSELLTVLDNLKKNLDRYLRLALIEAQGHDLDAAQALRRASNLTGSLLDSLTSAVTVVQNFQLESNIREAAKRARLYYHETLEQCLDQATLERSGQWPSYIIADIVRLQINIERNEAFIDGKRAGTLEPTRLVEYITKRLEELLDKSFDATSFLSLLREAHEQVAAIHEQMIGDYTDIREVYEVLRSRIKGTGKSRYSEAKFGADLYRLCRGHLFARILSNGYPGPDRPRPGSA